MRRRTLAAAAAALAVAAGVAAGCGGDSESNATTEVTTAATTAPAPTAPATTPGTSTAPATTAGRTGAELTASSLPPADAISGVGRGTPRTIDSASEFVDVLYQTGDPAKPSAVRRLEEGGYRTAILRDQAGSDPRTGIALLRSYAIALGGDDAAKKEVADAVEEVRNAAAAQTQDVETGIPDAQAVRVDIRQGTVEGAVIFVTFPVGSEVYGIQAVATSAGALDQDEILGAARDLATSVGATP
jgi:hypothetical protein